MYGTLACCVGFNIMHRITEKVWENGKEQPIIESRVTENVQV